ncbi:hypothetical protein C8Q75DRAFT_772806 [Abortiporus biennis]|nr:hypothetical protein C8Q75DRAFT_772806 [Abortiporus biennis]
MTLLDPLETETRDILARQIASITQKSRDDINASRQKHKDIVAASEARMKEEIHTFRTETQCQLRPLHRQWNKLIPIAQLPLDILTKIFIIYSGWASGYLKSLLILTHVCQFWRAAALQSRLYWCYIRINRTPPPEEIHSSIGDEAPISIGMILSNLESDFKIPISMKQIHDRVRSLDIQLCHKQAIVFQPDETGDSLWKQFKDFFCLIAPSLEQLRIHCIHVSGQHDRPLTSFLSTLEFPRLTSLRIHCSCFDWDASMIGNNLRHLVFNDIPYHTSQLDDVYKTLCELEFLEILELHFLHPKEKVRGWSTHDYISPNPNYPRVKLPNLQTLEVSGHLVTVAAVMGDVKIGTETKVHLCCHFVHRDLSELLDWKAGLPLGSEYKKLFHHLAVNFDEFGNKSARIRTMQFLQLPARQKTMTFVAYDRVVLPTSYGVSSGWPREVLFDQTRPIFKISMNTGFGGHNFQNYDFRFFGYASYLQLQYLEVLHLEGDFLIHTPEPFRMMVNLRILTISGETSILNVLSHLAPQIGVPGALGDDTNVKQASKPPGKYEGVEFVFSGHDEVEIDEVNQANIVAEIKEKGGKTSGSTGDIVHSSSTKPTANLEYLLPFPILTTLVLCTDSRTDHAKAKIYQALQDTLAQRREYKAELKELYMTDNLRSNEMVDELQKAAGDTLILSHESWPSRTSTY